MVVDSKNNQEMLIINLVISSFTNHILVYKEF